MGNMFMELKGRLHRLGPGALACCWAAGRRLLRCGSARGARLACAQDLSYQNSWSWFLKPRAQAKEKKLLENFHAAGFPLPKGFGGN